MPGRPSSGRENLLARRDDVSLVEFTELETALREKGPASTAEGEALARLDRELEGHLDAGPERALVYGSSALLPVARRLEAEPLLGGEGRQVRAGDGVAWVRGPADSLGPGWRDRILDHPGVARVLGERALELHLAPPDRGWAVVCQSAWSFGPDRTRAIAVDPASPHAPAVLGWSPAPADWPSAIHDYRLGPTLLRALGEPRVQAFDGPLPF